MKIWGTGRMEPMKKQWIDRYTHKGKNVCHCCLEPFEGKVCPHCGCTNYYKGEKEEKKENTVIYY